MEVQERYKNDSGFWYVLQALKAELDRIGITEDEAEFKSLMECAEHNMSRLKELKQIALDKRRR